MNPLYKKIMSDVAKAAEDTFGEMDPETWKGSEPWEIVFASRLRSLADAEGEPPVGMEELCAQQKCRYCGKTIECECWTFKMPKVKPELGGTYYTPTFIFGQWGMDKLRFSSVMDERAFAAGEVYLDRAACEARIEELKKLTGK